MFHSIQEFIASALDQKNVSSFDSNGCVSYPLKGGRAIHFRYDKEGNYLLSVAELGKLSGADLPHQCAFLLVFNEIIFKNSGGCLGLDSSTGELYLSRAFCLNDSPSMVGNSLVGLSKLVHAAKPMDRLISVVSGLQSGPDGEGSFFNGVDCSTPGWMETLAIEMGVINPHLSSEVLPETLSVYHGMAKPVMEMLELSSVQPDEEDHYRFIVSDDLEGYTHFNAVLNEIVVSGSITLPDGCLPEHAKNFLEHCCYVHGTNNCALSVSDDFKLLRFLIATPLDVVQPDPVRLYQLIINFFLNLQKAKEYFAEVGHSSGTQLEQSFEGPFIRA